MMYKTHVVSSLSIGLAPFVIEPTLLEKTGFLGFQLYCFALVMGASFPDIDEPNSAVSRFVNKFIPFLPHLII